MRALNDNDVPGYAVQTKGFELLTAKTSDSQQN